MVRYARASGASPYNVSRLPSRRASRNQVFFGVSSVRATKSGSNGIDAASRAARRFSDSCRLRNNSLCFRKGSHVRRSSSTADLFAARISTCTSRCLLARAKKAQCASARRARIQMAQDNRLGAMRSSPSNVRTGSTCRRLCVISTAQGATRQALCASGGAAWRDSRVCRSRSGCRCTTGT